MSEKSKEIKELIDKIRGSTPSSELQKEVEAVIKADEEKAKILAETDKKKLDDIKAAEKKLKEDAIKEEAASKKKEADNADKIPPELPERDNTGKFKKKDPATPEEEEDEVDADAVIKELTEQMEKMSKEIEALKKRKNYRTKPPKADKVSELDDFIKQNITKDFEMVV